MARNERPINRWISVVRPSTFPFLSRDLRWGVEPGSMLYSAVIQPLPLPTIQSGTFCSKLAVQSTTVSPHWYKTEPGVVLVNPRVTVTGRIPWTLIAVTFLE